MADPVPRDNPPPLPVFVAGILVGILGYAVLRWVMGMAVWILVGAVVVGALLLASRGRR